MFSVPSHADCHWTCIYYSEGQGSNLNKIEFVNYTMTFNLNPLVPNQGCIHYSEGRSLIHHLYYDFQSQPTWRPTWTLMYIDMFITGYTTKWKPSWVTPLEIYALLLWDTADIATVVRKNFGQKIFFRNFFKSLQISASRSKKIFFIFFHFSTPLLP